MQFEDAYRGMQLGKRATRPDWGGYWYWCHKNRTIMIHTREGNEFDIRLTEDVDYTMRFMFMDDWILVDPA